MILCQRKSCHFFFLSVCPTRPHSDRNPHLWTWTDSVLNETRRRLCIQEAERRPEPSTARGADGHWTWVLNYSLTKETKTNPSSDLLLITKQVELKQWRKKRKQVDINHQWNFEFSVICFFLFASFTPKWGNKYPAFRPVTTRCSSLFFFFFTDWHTTASNVRFYY